MSMQQPQSITSKELSYITDSLKNEELIAKLCLQGARSVKNEQTAAYLEHLGRGRLDCHQRLLQSLHEQTQPFGMTH